PAHPTRLPPEPRPQRPAHRRLPRTEPARETRSPTAMRTPILACALLLAVGCRGPELPRSGEVPRSLTAEEVPLALERAREELALGRTAVALEWMVRAGALKGLPVETRNEVQSLLERAAEARIEELERTAADPKELE